MSFFNHFLLKPPNYMRIQSNVDPASVNYSVICAFLHNMFRGQQVKKTFSLNILTWHVHHILLCSMLYINIIGAHGMVNFILVSTSVHHLIFQEITEILLSASIDLWGEPKWATRQTVRYLDRRFVLKSFYPHVALSCTSPGSSAP